MKVSEPRRVGVGNSGRDVDRDGGGSERVVGGVAVAAPVEQVVAAEACEQVVSAAAGERVRARVTDQGVVESRADHVRDARDRVGAAVAVGVGDSGGDDDRDGGGSERVVGGVAAAAAVKQIVAGATYEQVIAAAAVEPVRDVVADQGVVVGGPVRVLDVDEGVGTTVAVGVGNSCRDVDRDGSGSERVVSGVAAATAVKQIVAGAT